MKKMKRNEHCERERGRGGGERERLVNSEAILENCHHQDTKKTKLGYKHAIIVVLNTSISERSFFYHSLSSAYQQKQIHSLPIF